MTRTIEIATPPSLPALLARAALPLPRRSGDALPDLTLRRTGVAIDRDHVATYAHECGFRLTDEVPSTYPFVLTFPLGLQAMSDPAFPFPLMGMVHIANRITSHRPVRAGEQVDLEVTLADLRPHRSGQQFDLVAQVTAGGEVAWRCVSTMLRRGSSSDEAPPSTGGAAGALAATVPTDEVPDTATWRVDGRTGRRYAAVSGDYNPIHLTALTAKPLGFPRAIAHGMWTAARALAGVASAVPTAHTYDVGFSKPVLLPSKVRYATQYRDDGTDVVVRSGDDRLHLVGRIEPV